MISDPGITQQISGDLTNAGLLDIESSQTNGVIAYPTQDSSGNQNIFLIEPDGTGRTQLTFDTTTDLLPSWSPDGAQLAYVDINSSGVSNIWVINADGSDSHQIAAQANSPAWSPSNTQIAYTSDMSGNTEIWTMSSDGSNQKRLTTSPSSSVGNYGPSFSPDGKQIVYVQFSPGDVVAASLWIMNADGSDQHQLTSGTWNNYDQNGNIINAASSANAPSWGSNNIITFWSGVQNQAGQIWTINPDGSDRKQLTFNPYPYATDEPEWSPDGTEILYTSNVSGSPAIWLMNSDGSGENLLTNITAMPAQNDAAWQPRSTGSRTSVEIGGTLVTENTTPPAQSPAVLNDFSWAQGWGSPDNPRTVTDVNGDGASDYVGFGDSSTFIAYGGTFSNGQGSDGPGFSGATVAVNDFGTSEGYTADMQRGAAAAGVGDGDILYGQGYAGVYWYSATGETAATDAAGNTYNVLQYQSTPNLYGNFGSQEGWTSDNGFQILQTNSSDATASILGFGDDGIVVGPDAFASGASAASSYVIPLDAGNNSGWKQSVDVRSFTDQSGKPIDLNGDGIADFVGMGPDGLVYAYGSESGGTYGLGALQTAHIEGGSSDLGEAQNWTDATTVRDIVYDAKTGYDDIVAFGAAGVYVSMGQDPNTHNGEPFGQLYLAMADFGSNQGWSVNETPRLIGDVTGDGIPDIVGFGTNSTFVAVGSRDSSGNLQFTVDTSKTIADFGSAEGWSGSTEQAVRALGTVAGSGGTGAHADLILSGANNTQVWHVT